MGETATPASPGKQPLNHAGDSAFISTQCFERRRFGKKGIQTVKQPSTFDYPQKYYVGRTSTIQGIDEFAVLHRTRHKIGNFRDVPQADLLV